RETPEEDLKPEDYQQIRDVGAACLSGGDGQQLLKFIQDEKNQQGIVKSMGCGLLAPLVDELVRNKKSHDHCQAAITQLTKTCSSRTLLESFLELIEDMDPGAISETILVLLPHLQTLLQLDENRAAGVGLALSALHKQLSRLPVPYTQQQEEDDEHGLCRCCVALVTFTRPFIDGVKKDENCNPTPEDDELKAEILKVILPAIKESLPGLLFFSSLRKFTTMDTDLSKESTACLAYLLFVQLIAMDTFPAVFPVFILQCNMEHINQLLSKKESHLLKGLALFAKSLEKVEDNSLPVGLLDLESFYSAPQNLRQVLTDCPIQHLRESGLKVFQLFINKLDAEAKHKFFCMLKTSHHAGVEGYIVNNIRSQIQSSIKIMESLNLLRCLLMRDKEMKSDADVWEEICRIKDEFLKMLRVCISMSRAYYSAEMKALKEEQKLRAKAKEDARSTRLLKAITVKHDKVTQMSPEVLQSALVTFDLMESLVVRIDEITEEKQG
uniref:Glomulin, FKBP associated protein b n=1 Tax=Poecilia latipinna TaxID=48699 RepID=A0A3B3U5K1_9TELE